jgi:hypothetical protein
MATRMQQRRGTSAEWAAANPLLADGEIGYEKDTRVIKVGDGSTLWNQLPVTLSGLYLPVGGTAFDSERLDGLDSTAFLKGSDASETADASKVARRNSAGQLVAAQATAAGHVPTYGQLSSFGRYRGAGTTWPTTDNRQGDSYFHNSVGQLGIFDGTVYRLIRRGSVTTATARDALTWAYAGLQVLVTDEGVLYEYQNTFVGWTRPWSQPWGELLWFGINVAQNATGDWVDYGAGIVPALPKGRRVRIRGQSHWYTASTNVITVNTRLGIMRDVLEAPSTVIWTGADHDRRIGGSADSDLADFYYDVPYNIAGTLSKANTRFFVQGKHFGTPSTTLYTAGTSEHNSLCIEDVGPYMVPPTS